MKPSEIGGIVGIAGCMTAGYITYVVITHGDGVALAALMTGLGTLAGYCVGKVRASQKSP